METQPIEKLYENEHLTISYNREENWLEIDWLGFQTFDSIRSSCMIMLDYLKKHNCSKVLNDNSQVLGTWSEAADWGAEFWFPVMIDAGLRHFAWIYSPSTFGKLSADKTITLTNKDIFATFNNREEAIEWLHTIDKKVPY